MIFDDHDSIHNEDFYLPAEWEPQQAVWMLWPTRKDTWRERAHPVREVYVEIIRKIAQHTPIILGVLPQHVERVTERLQGILNVTIVSMVYDDVWIRDTGATFLKHVSQPKLFAMDWEFNAWGGFEDGVYYPWDNDQLVGNLMAKYHQTPAHHTKDFVLEGGSFICDGKGTLITTKACLLSRGRNPKLSKAEIENKLKTYLNVKKVIWLPHGVVNDETNEHVDNIVAFAPKNTILLGWTDNIGDPQFSWSQEVFEILQQETTANNEVFTIIKVPFPEPKFSLVEEIKGLIPSVVSKNRRSDERLAASYINFFVTNNLVLVPTFDDPNDLVAVEVLKRAFPRYEVYPFRSREILLGGGNVHCLTQPIPALTKANE